MQDNAPNPLTLTEADAAKYLGVSPSFLAASRLRKPRTEGPPFIKIGRRVLYLKRDLDVFLETRGTTAKSQRDTAEGNAIAREAGEAVRAQFAASLLDTEVSMLDALDEWVRPAERLVEAYRLYKRERPWR